MIWLKIGDEEKVKVTLINREELKEKWYGKYPLDTFVEVIRYSKVIMRLPLDEVFDYVREKW